MKCNSCWRNLEGRAISTACGHIFCTEDANRILSSDSTCPMCEEMLSKSKMTAVDLSPNDEWINTVMAGVPPQSIMKSAFKGVIFWIGQKDVEVQLTVSKAMQLREKCEQMQAKCTEKLQQVEAAYTAKLQQVHTAYQKAMKKIQAMTQELESVKKDKTELQEKYTEKSRQKRKLEEMYDALRKEYEQLKQKDRAMVQQRNPYTFSDPTPSGFDEPAKTRPPTGLAPITPASSADFWTAPPEVRSLARPSSADHFKSTAPLFTPAAGHPTNVLRNLLLSPMPRPHSRIRASGF